MSQLRVSHPGHPTVLIPDRDPFHGLTQRQRHILEVVYSFGGNRSRAARHLGITPHAVQTALRLCERAGVRVPVAVDGRQGRPDLRPRKRRAS